MAKVSQELFEGKSMGFTEAAREGVKEAALGFLSAAREVGGSIWDGAAPMFNHGRTEMAAALFSGQPYVLYQRGVSGIEQGQDQPLHGPDIKPEMQQERDGMSM